MQRLPIPAVLLKALGGSWFLILAVQFFGRGDWTMGALVGAAAIGLFWLVGEELSRRCRP